MTFKQGSESCPTKTKSLNCTENVLYLWCSLNLLLLFLSPRIYSLSLCSNWLHFWRQFTDSVFCFLFSRRFPLVVTSGYVFYTSLHSYYLSGLSPFGSRLSWSAVPKTRHRTLAAALPALSRAEVPVRHDGAAHKVLQPISAARSVDRPLQQSRLPEMQESPCHVPSFPPLLAMHLPL